jgi:hypothetical protein
MASIRAKNSASASADSKQTIFRARSSELINDVDDDAVSEFPQIYKKQRRLKVQTRFSWRHPGPTTLNESMNWYESNMEAFMGCSIPHGVDYCGNIRKNLGDSSKPIILTSVYACTGAGEAVGCQIGDRSKLD